MNMYAQHGYGKSDDIQEGLARGHIQGVILSPRDEDPTALKAFATALHKKFLKKATILFDPQFYVTTIPAAKDGNLPAYPYYAPSLTRATFTPSAVQNYAKDVIDFQSGIGVDAFVAPTVSFNGFRDPW